LVVRRQHLRFCESIYDTYNNIFKLPTTVMETNPIP